MNQRFPSFVRTGAPAHRRTGAVLAAFWAGLLILFSGLAHGQAPGWQAITTAVNTGVVSSTAEFTDVATDAAGNVLVTGFFSGSVRLGTTTLTSAGDDDGFVAKYDPTTARFVWVQQISGTSFENAVSIAVSGNSIYVGVNVGVGAVNLGNLSIAGNNFDVLVTKLTDAGATASFTWVRRLTSTGGNSFDNINQLTANDSSVYLVGYVSGNATSCTADNVTLNLANGRNFLLKMTDAGSSGSFVWGITTDASTADVAANATGVYVTGGVSFQALVGGFALTANNSQGNSEEAYLAKATDFGAIGTFTWAITGGGPGSSERPSSLTLSGNNVYVAGTATGSNSTFGSSALTLFGNADAFVFKATDAGNSASIIWGKVVGSNRQDAGLGIAINGSNVFLAGFFKGATLLGSGTAVSNTGSPSTTGDVFLTKFTDNGTTATTNWSQGAGGAGEDYAGSMALVGNTAHIIGQIAPPALFGTIAVGSTTTEPVAFLATVVGGPTSTLGTLSPGSGAVGTAVTVSGTNLTGTTALTLNGVAVPGFTVNAGGTAITFTVPAGATAGPVVATTANGPATAAGSFCVQYAPTATGASRCGPGSVTLLASGAPAGGSYAWYAAATGGSPVSTGNAANFATPALSASTTYYVGVTTGSGSSACEGPRSAATATLNAAPLLSVTAPGGTVLCPGGSLTLAATGASSYVWSNGATGASISVTTPGNYTVTGTSAAGCPATSGTTTISSGGTPTASIAAGGPTTLCPGGSVVLTANAGTSYLWSTGATSQAITVSAPGSYTVTVGNGSCTATSAPVAVSQGSAATANVAANGPTTFCPGGSVSLTASGTAGSTFVWSTGATTATISVAQAGSYTITATTPGGCTATSAPVAVSVSAAPVANAGPAASFCSGGSAQLGSPAQPGTAYAWSPATGLSNASAAQPTLTLTTTGGAPLAQTYTLTATNAAGCAASSQVTATVNPAAQASIFAGGPTTLCPGGSVTLTASSAPGNAYRWNTGATTASISATQAGAYTVTVTAAGGCSATSAATTVSIGAAATAGISAGGPTTFCPGGSVVLTATGVPGSSFVWSTGATTPTISATQGGSYTVIATNAGGCTATSAATAVTVNPTPATPVVTGNVGNLTATSSAASGNQWYINGTLIPGATGQTIATATTRQQGLYSVVVTSAAGCASAPSNQVLLVVLGTAPAALAAQVQVFPNPTTGRFTLALPATRAAQVQVLNALGQAVQTRTATGPVALDLSGLARGVYAVRVTLGADVVTRRLVLE